MQFIDRGEWGSTDSAQEENMSVQDLLVTEAKREKLQEEKAIVDAVVRYFESAPSKLKSPAGDTESFIINALHRYFIKAKK